jgi:hypothetical protein
MAPSPRVENQEGDDTYGTSEFANYFRKRITYVIRRENFEKSKYIDTWTPR